MRLYSPVAQALLRRMGLGRTLEDVCSEKMTIEGSCLFERMSAIHLAGEVERVTGFAPRRSRELELSRLRPGPMPLCSLEAYVLNEALCIDGNVYKGLAKHIVVGSTRTALAQLAEFDMDCVLVGDRQSHLYFGHWLTEELPLTSIGQRLGPIAATHFGRQRYGHEAGYLGLYGLQTPIELPSRGVVRRLTVMLNRGVNQAHLKAIVAFKNTLRSRGWRRLNDAVFVRRGGGSSRSLTNEAEVMEYLERMGCRIINPEAMTPEEIARACFDARLAIGVEGSHLAHAFLQMDDRATMVVIQPPARFNNPFKDLCDATDRRYAFVVGEARGDGFHLACERLGATLELCHP